MLRTTEQPAYLRLPVGWQIKRRNAKNTQHRQLRDGSHYQSNYFAINFATLAFLSDGFPSRVFKVERINCVFNWFMEGAFCVGKYCYCLFIWITSKKVGGFDQDRYSRPSKKNLHFQSNMHLLVRAWRNWKHSKEPHQGRISLSLRPTGVAKSSLTCLPFFVHPIYVHLSPNSDDNAAHKY